MAKRMKVYLPRWVLAITIPILGVVWGVITYLAFGTTQGEQLGVPGWLGLTVLLILVGIMMWLMTGRLPAYLIEMDEDKSS
ncbi:MAG TPA: hypothetical protein VD793_06235 [Gemmatimonadales bacterium]|nr:hypothetical protein [Gemmatimonadales bacterium]